MQLWSKEIPYYDKNIEFIPYLTPYIKEGAKTAIVVCPGGGYAHRAEHEGNTIAEWLNEIGVTAYVLEYRVAPYHAPAEPSDIQRAMRVVRKEAERYGFEKIGVMGFSAGGHLAATVSVHYDKHFYDPTDEIDAFSARPDFSVLCYPVIDLFTYRHDGSRTNLLERRPKKSDCEFYSLQMQVTDDTPPAFIWHAADDVGVPTENSLLYALALAEHNISYEMHIYPFGGHGLGLAKQVPHMHQWTTALKNWLGTL